MLTYYHTKDKCEPIERFKNNYGDGLTKFMHHFLIIRDEDCHKFFLQRGYTLYHDLETLVRKEIADWFKNNMNVLDYEILCYTHFDILYGFFIFRNKKDCMNFKLIWG